MIKAREYKSVWAEPFHDFTLNPPSPESTGQDYQSAERNNRCIDEQRLLNNVMGTLNIAARFPVEEDIVVELGQIRLPTQTEWLYVLIEGANRLQSNGKDIPISSARDLNEQMPAAFYTPNAFGIRGMNEGLAEWALRVLTDPPKDMTHENRYAVIGGMEGEPKDGGPIPAVIDRFPFESCEDTGFRTVMGLAEKK
jgi:hypothetical protein